MPLGLHNYIFYGKSIKTPLYYKSDFAVSKMGDCCIQERFQGYILDFFNKTKMEAGELEFTRQEKAS